MTTITPDYETAAIKATETLIKYNVSFAPIAPLPIIKSIPGILVVSFAEMAERMSIERNNIISAFGSTNQDAVTVVKNIGGKTRYLVAYNQRLPLYLLQRALARELGHIILGHDGSLPEETRIKEALCFAQHFLCPRALIKSIQDQNIPLTVEVVGNITGCYERCLANMRKTPGTHIPASLNRKIKEQFADYIENYVAFQCVLKDDDESMLANFGTFMDGYEE